MRIDSWKVLKNHLLLLPNAWVMYKVDGFGEETGLSIVAESLAFDKHFKTTDEKFDQAIRFVEEIEGVAVKNLP